MQKGGALQNVYTKTKYKKDGTVKKSTAISEKKFDRKSKRYLNKRGLGYPVGNTKKTRTVVKPGGRKSVSRTTVATKPPVKARRAMAATKPPVKARKAPARKAPARKAPAKKASAKKKVSRYTYAKF